MSIKDINSDKLLFSLSLALTAILMFSLSSNAFLADDVDRSDWEVPTVDKISAFNRNLNSTQEWYEFADEQNLAGTLVDEDPNYNTTVNVEDIEFKNGLENRSTGVTALYSNDASDSNIKAVKDSLAIDDIPYWLLTIQEQANWAANKTYTTSVTNHVEKDVSKTDAITTIMTNNTVDETNLKDDAGDNVYQKFVYNFKTDSGDTKNLTIQRDTSVSSITSATGTGSITIKLPTSTYAYTQDLSYILDTVTSKSWALSQLESITFTAEITTGSTACDASNTVDLDFRYWTGVVSSSTPQIAGQDVNGTQIKSDQADFSPYSTDGLDVVEMAGVNFKAESLELWDTRGKESAYEDENQYKLGWNIKFPDYAKITSYDTLKLNYTQGVPSEHYDADGYIELDSTDKSGKLQSDYTEEVELKTGLSKATIYNLEILLDFEDNGDAYTKFDQMVGLGPGGGMIGGAANVVLSLLAFFLPDKTVIAIKKLLY